MTQGKFFLSLAVLAGSYQPDKPMLKTLILKHASECDIDVDPEGPYDESKAFAEALWGFLNVVRDSDVLAQYAHMHLVWEAHGKYVEHRATRIRSRALSKQFDLRHTPRQ